VLINYKNIMRVFILGKNKIMNLNIRGAIYILIALLPLFLLMNKFPYLSVVSFLFLFVTSIIYFFNNRIITEYHYRVNIFLLIICLYFILSYFLSNQPLANLFSYDFLRFDGSFFFCYLPFFIFAVPFLNYRKTLNIYLWFLFIIFLIFAVIGFFEYSNNLHFFTVVISKVEIGPELRALNNSHNATGSVAAVASIFALAFFLESDKKEKIPYAGILILLFIMLIITKSRGSLVTFAVAVIFLLWVNSKSFLKFIRNLFLMIAVLIPFIFATGTYKRIAQIINIYDENILTRFSLWDKAIYLFKQSPILGVGFGRYNDIVWKNYDMVHLSGYPGIFALYKMPGYIFDTSNAHNSYLQFMAETGVIGLILVISFWIFCFVIIFKSYKLTGDKFAKKVYLSVIGSIIALFVLSLTENYMSAPGVMMCISTVTSLAIGLTWEEKRSVSHL
jgi:O-antigen ligase